MKNSSVRKLTLLFLLLSKYFIPTHSQIQTSFGVPFIPQVLSFSAKDYHAGNQNWSVCQNSEGVVYFGNNQGLLQYDGTGWHLYRIPNNSAVRSVYVDQQDRVFVGGYEEFGFFQADHSNQLHYTSLSSSIKEQITLNDEFWTIHQYKGKIFFQSFSSYYIYDGIGVVKGLNTDIPLFIFHTGDQLYMQYINGDFAQFNGTVFQTYISRSQLQNSSVVSALALNQGLLLVTDNAGLFYAEAGNVVPWSNEVNTLLKNNICNRAIMTPDSTVIIGTITDGVYALSNKGTLLWHLNRENSLKNNTVLSLYCDNNQNVWVGLDNGIAYIRKNSPVSLYEPKDIDLGMVYDLLMYRDDLYCATNQGVYRFNRTHKPVLPFFKNQCWHLTRIDRQVFMGHNKGVYTLNENKEFSHVDGPQPGSILIRKCEIFGREVLIQMSYASFSVFEKDEATGQWRFSHVIEGFNNRIRSFEVDHQGNIWGTHIYKGIYRLTLDKSLCKVNEIVYYQTLQNNQPACKIDVMKLRGRIIFTDRTHFYTYEDLHQYIVAYEPLDHSFSELADTYRICEVNNTYSWFVRDNEYTLMGFEDGHYYVKERIPFSLFQNAPIENQGMVYVPDDNVSYFTFNGGIGRFDFNSLDQKMSPQLLFVSAVSMQKNDSVINLALKDSDNEYVEYASRNIDIQLSYPDYSGEEFRLLSRVSNTNNSWQHVDGNRIVHLTNLPYGKHIFEGVVKGPKDTVLAKCILKFTIKRPFYESYLAYFIYFIAFIAFLFFCLRQYTLHLSRKQQIELERVRQEQAEQLKHQEQVIMRLEKEKLEDQVTYKSKELAGATMTLIQYDDFLKGLKADLQQAMIKGNASRKFYEGIIHRIDEKLVEDDEWGVFQANFDRIHENFFRNLKERYPDLTAGDLRLCALLRLNMSTKDMARMQNLSVRGIEAARYRLRKKLNLSEGCNLVDFMIQFR